MAFALLISRFRGAARHNTSRFRRSGGLSAAALAVVLGVLALTATAGPSAAREFEGSNEPASAYTEPRQIRVVALMSPNSQFTPHVIFIASVDGVLRAPLPRWADAVPASRLDLSGVPLIGGIFGQRSAIHEIEPEQRVGALLRRGDALVAQFDRASPTGWANQPVRLVTRAPMTHEIVSITLKPKFTPSPQTRSIEHPAPAAPGTGQPIGDVYLSPGGLVLAPPLEWLTGFDLQ